MNAYILEDAAGKLWQYLDAEVAEYPVKQGEGTVFRESHLGGWYDLSCRPVPEHAITHPVTVMWRRDN